MPRPEIQRSAMLGSHSLWKGGVIFLVQLVGPVAPGGGTPLQIASQEGYYNVALILLKAGAVIEGAHVRPSIADSLPEQRMLRLLARWRCATCDRPLRKEKTCGRCRSVSYCSRECQRGDWAQHKATCTPQSALGGLHRA
jgi:hypothetical protein